MGLYVNPTSGSKEAWLREHSQGGDVFVAAAPWLAGYERAIEQGRIPVVLVDNGVFTALGVAFDRREAESWARPDGRTKLFATVPRSALADATSGVGDDLLRSFHA
jgi:hypothetical protein